MDFELGERADALRARLRDLLAEMLPEDWAGPFSDDPDVRAITEKVCERLAEQKLLTSLSACVEGARHLRASKRAVRQ